MKVKTKFQMKSNGNIGQYYCLANTDTVDQLNFKTKFFFKKN